MKAYGTLSKDELLQLHTQLVKEYEEAKGKGLKLDMSRGKPSISQMDMEMGIMDVLGSIAEYHPKGRNSCSQYLLPSGTPLWIQAHP